MPLVIGHSQVKYFSEYLDPEEYAVFSYPGYRTWQFMEEDVLKDVLPFHSAVVVVVGANDIGNREPWTCDDCRGGLVLHGQEAFPERNNSGVRSSFSWAEPLSWKYSGRGDASTLELEAIEVNRRLRQFASQQIGVEVIPQGQFHTSFGVNRRLLSKDGLHLSFSGTETFVSNVEVSVRNCVRAVAPVVPIESAAPMSETVESAAPMSATVLARNVLLLGLSLQQVDESLFLRLSLLHARLSIINSLSVNIILFSLKLGLSII